MSATAAVTYTAEYAAETRMPVIVGVLTTFFLIALAIVCLRIYVRTLVTHSFGADDVLIILAILCQFGGWVAILVQAQNGLGRHTETLSTETLKIFNHASFAGNVVGIVLATLFMKLSIATNLLRLCNNRWYTIALWFIIGLTIAYELVAFLFFFVNCKPVSGNWDTSVGATCADLHTIVVFGLVNTSCNIFTDVALAAIPIPIIWGLNMKKTTRLYLIGVLSLGYLAVAMDIVKTVYQETYTVAVDEVYLITFGTLYGLLGIIAASVPMLKPLVSRVLGLDSTQDHSYYAYGSNGGGNASHARTIGGTRGNGTRGGGARSAVRRGDGTQVDNIDDPAYELDERDSDPGGSLSSDRKSDGINSTSVYRHDASSQDNILYYVPGVSNKTTIENGNPNRSDSSLNGTPGGGAGSISRAQSNNNFRGIKMTTEVSVKR
ncbi:hypothetical protein SCUCBS95973_007485 [Sporothrix curviconia]|uniref:Rhodopsin domain-containing protein n=1 Tax=Sporothrix curviconia TaxID=1260050 RepID=A0ABP0CGG3_9PEZI